MGQSATRTPPIPVFTSVEEEAAFWSNHDTTEFEDDWVPVALHVANPLQHSLIVPFEGETFHRLVALAQAKNAAPAVFVATMVADALDRESEDDHAD